MKIVCSQIDLCHLSIGASNAVPVTDVCFRQPEIIAVPVEAGDEFIILATDGLWDVMDSADAVNYVKFSLEAGLKKESVAHQMVQEALRRGTYDNVTVVIVWL